MFILLMMVAAAEAAVQVVMVEILLLQLAIPPLVAPVEQERQQYFLDLFLHPLYLHQIAPPGQTQSDPQDCLLVAAAVVLVEEVHHTLNLDQVDLAEADLVVQML